MIPAFQFRAAPGGAWRVAVGALAVTASAAAADWLLSLSSGPLPLLLVAALSAAGCVAAAASLLRVRPAELAWDGRRFRCGAVDGALDLCIDLGGWMLLRWRPGATRRPWAARWLPVSASAAGPAGWHALRCALHAPVPAVSDV